MTGRLSVYVYFRAAAGKDGLVQSALGALAQTLAATRLPIPALLRRPDIREGVRTWMEVYQLDEAADAEQFMRQLSGAVASSGLADLIDGERHIEIFEAVNRCA